MISKREKTDLFRDVFPFIEYNVHFFIQRISPERQIIQNKACQFPIKNIFSGNIPFHSAY